MEQRTSEWLNLSNESTRELARTYHVHQFDTPYRSTIAFDEWVSTLIDFTKVTTICDVACGAGANIYYLQQKHPHVSFTGIDINPELISEGEVYFEKQPSKSTPRLIQGDLYAFPGDLQGQFDGVLMFQTLFALPEFSEPIKRLASLDPDWIGLTSLCFDGNVEAKIEICDYTRRLNDGTNRKAYYNINSLKSIKEVFTALGYDVFTRQFEIDVDIEKPEHGGMGTHTIKTADGKRLQISGPILMSWYFILARKKV